MRARSFKFLSRMPALQRSLCRAVECLLYFRWLAARFLQDLAVKSFTLLHMSHTDVQAAHL